MEVAPRYTQKLKEGRELVWILKKTLFLGFSNFSKVFKRLCVLEHSRENSLLDLDLDGVSFPISLLKRVKLIFASLLPSRASNIHSRRTLKVTAGVK